MIGWGNMTRQSRLYFESALLHPVMSSFLKYLISIVIQDINQQGIQYHEILVSSVRLDVRL